MNLWIDAQLAPAIANWLNLNFAITAVPLRDLGLRDATDREIFFAARREGAIVMTKDSDFIRLLKDVGSPPQVIWLRCGNTSNANLKRILADNLPSAIEFLQLGEALVEVG